MTEQDAELEELSIRIVEHEVSRSERPSLALEATLQRLYVHMTPLVGPQGFRAVLHRAAHLVRSEYPWLELEHDSDERLTSEELEHVVEREGRARVTEGAAALLERVLALLCNFIGEGLTLRSVRRAWPDLPPTPEDPAPEESCDD